MCGGLERESIGVTKDAMVDGTDTWKIWRCGACATAWLDPRPDDASLPAAYDFDYITHRPPAPPTRASWLTKLIDGYLNYRFSMNRSPSSRWGVPFFALLVPLRLKLDYYGRHLSPGKGGRLLDIGCGNGDFVALARSMNWEAEGLDPDSGAVAACRQRGIPVTEGFVSDLDTRRRHGYWHAVTMSHCLEHVPDPQSMLRDVHAMLAPGGTVWMGLPNPESIGARVYGANWESYDAPRHLSLPSLDALLAASRHAGFSVVHARYRGAHTARLYRQSAQIARKQGQRGFRYSRCSATLLSWAADLLATVSVRHAEELVIVARKAHVSSTEEQSA
jgi:2-polyprenyl-3-methyl-5-hydroxy-6-metoxy-1,4-benzoquinol methylase